VYARWLQRSPVLFENYLLETRFGTTHILASGQEADYYVERWNREDDLIRVRNHDDGYVILLSSPAERLIDWFEDMQDRGMIGTESRWHYYRSWLSKI
jgi:hypothetical protein